MVDLKEEIYKAHVANGERALVSELNSVYGGSKYAPPTPPVYLYWDLDHELLLPGSGTKNCSNYEPERAGLWARDDPKAVKGHAHPEAPFLNRLAQLCLGARIRQCNSSACSHQRMAMESTAPGCEWRRFRQWAIAVIACQASFTHEQKLTMAHTHLVTAVSLCHWLLIGYKHDERPIQDVIVGTHSYRVDLAGVCEVIYWMLTIQATIGVGNVAEGKWGPKFLPDAVFLPAISRAQNRARKLGICQYRLQKLTEVAERKEVDLHGFMEAARHYPLLSHCHIRPGEAGYDADHYHGECTPEYCRPNKADTTKKAQVHKCPPGDRAGCRIVQYLVDDLESSIRTTGVSSWSIYNRRPATPRDPYVAISHVWIDGTGIGNGPDPKKKENMGLVHCCLDAYFRRITARLNCTGFWWDTISLPTDDKVRKQEIDTMHYKYRSATHTVVHDNYLVNMEWADDGSPCIALVLSSWFTRGWTALELHESKSVKVLYKGPDPQNPLIKDLDDDILAKDPRYSTRAYWLASSIIRRLRRPVEDTRDLLTILRPRETCKREDRTTIAGLLANLKPDDCPECLEPRTEKTIARIKKHIDRHTTRRVLTTLGKVGIASMMHGKASMCESGPFCWAPEEVHEMPVDSAGDLQPGVLGDGLISVDQDGRARGDWDYRGLSPEDAASNVVPINGLDERTAARIRESLQNWQSCIILRESWQDKGPALLGVVVGQEHVGSRDILDCRYIGTVMVLDDSNPYVGHYDDRYSHGTIRFGNDNGKPDVRLQDVVEVKALPPRAAQRDDIDAEDTMDGESDGPARPWYAADNDNISDCESEISNSD